MNGPHLLVRVFFEPQRHNDTAEHNVVNRSAVLRLWFNRYLCIMPEHPVILFDGVCNFCNRTVNFIIKHDKKKIFRYAPLQSDIGQQLLKLHGLSTVKLNSFVLIDNGRTYTKTTAALHLYPKLGGAWKLMKALWIFPPFLRNFTYDIIASNRYRWWGKKDACMIPSAEVRSLFLS